ncbi:hypothetical protein F4778DRAFT_795151 [Xylariomycetidae sp. FL2044]|nr:hypothetical protein F4778DRAFT_795142 [Xylariomycetidae sp. FL2044]KAH9892224.1 hypothetical protein F4778DRAFT_795151 [Xylariomycetidae sp. FL2044]
MDRVTIAKATAMAKSSGLFINLGTRKRDQRPWVEPIRLVLGDEDDNVSDQDDNTGDQDEHTGDDHDNAGGEDDQKQLPSVVGRAKVLDLKDVPLEEEQAIRQQRRFDEGGYRKGAGESNEMACLVTIAKLQNSTTTPFANPHTLLPFSDDYVLSAGNASGYHLHLTMSSPRWGYPSINCKVRYTSEAEDSGKLLASFQFSEEDLGPLIECRVLNTVELGKDIKKFRPDLDVTHAGRRESRSHRETPEGLAIESYMKAKRSGFVDTWLKRYCPNTGKFGGWNAFVESPVRQAYNVRDLSDFDKGCKGLLANRPQDAFFLPLADLKSRDPKSSTVIYDWVGVFNKPNYSGILPAEGETFHLNIPRLSFEVPDDQTTEFTYPERIEKLYQYLVSASKDVIGASGGFHWRKAYMESTLGELLRPGEDEEDKQVREELTTGMADELMPKRLPDNQGFESTEEYHKRIRFFAKYGGFVFLASAGVHPFSESKSQVKVNLKTIDVDPLSWAKTLANVEKQCNYRAHKVVIIRKHTDETLQPELQAVLRVTTTVDDTDKSQIAKLMRYHCNFKDADVVLKNVPALFPSFQHLRDRLDGKRAEDCTSFTPLECAPAQVGCDET